MDVFVMRCFKWLPRGAENSQMRWRRLTLKNAIIAPSRNLALLIVKICANCAIGVFVWCCRSMVSPNLM